MPRAVLMSYYVVLLIAIVSEGPAAHADETTGQLAAVVAVVNQNADNLASLVETAKETRGILEPIAQGAASLSGMMNQYVRQYITDIFMKSACKLNETKYPDGSNLEGDRSWCTQTCTRGKWTVDHSSLCCEYNGVWRRGTIQTDNREEGRRRTCEDGKWNIIWYDPVMEFRLLPRKENVKSIQLRYYTGRNYSGEPYSSKHWYVDSLNSFIENTYSYTYAEMGMTWQDVTDCTLGTRLTDVRKVCRFSLDEIKNKCNAHNGWGYSRSNGSAPCVFLKMNRMIGWTPDVYTNIDELYAADMPDDLIEHINNTYQGRVPEMVWVHCKCENPADEQYITEIEYTPWPGFPAYYFPYWGLPGYVDPIVAVRFVAPAPNVSINIECKAYAKNLIHNRKERLGFIHFELQKQM